MANDAKAPHCLENWQSAPNFKEVEAQSLEAIAGIFLRQPTSPISLANWITASCRTARNRAIPSEGARWR